MVVTRRPATEPTGVMHDRVARPSRCTVQAPHWAMPQPYLVPVSPSVSRRTQSSGVSGASDTVRGRPLTVKVRSDIDGLLSVGPRGKAPIVSLLRAQRLDGIDARGRPR